MHGVNTVLYWPVHVSLPPCKLAWGVGGSFPTFLFFPFNFLKESLKTF